MPDRKKSVLAILIIGICTAFFLSRKCFWSSDTREKKGQEENVLLSNDETVLLLNKIENLLGESKEKKTSQEEAGRTFRTVMYPDEEETWPSANQASSVDQEIKDTKRNERAISGSAQDYGTALPGSAQHRPGNRLSEADRGQGKGQSAEDASKKMVKADKEKPVISIRYKEEPSSFQGGIISIQKTKGRSDKSESQLMVANFTNGGASVSSTPSPGNQTLDSANNSTNNNEEAKNEPKEKPEVEPTTTPWSIEFCGHVNARAGSCMYAYNSEGTVCGKTLVKEGGQYGVLHIYLDDLGTEKKEGVRLGEPITFMVDGKVAVPREPGQAVCQGGSDLKHVDLVVDLGTES